MRIAILVLLCSFLLASCKQKDEKKNNTTQLSSDTDSSHIKALPPLPKEELTLTDKDFGKIIELKGTSYPVNQVFKVSETEMIAKDSILIVKNRNNSDIFMVYSLPDFKFLKSFGRIGKGPNEFQFPSLVRTENDTILCFIFEQANEKLYSLNKKFKIQELPLKLKEKKNFSENKLYGISSNEFYYVESTKKGKAIFHIESRNDSVSTTLIKNLAFSDKYKNWAAYIGDFGGNKKKNRLVYAYKYFKRLLFYDLKNRISRVISFNLDLNKNSSAISMMSPSNITHYWGMSAQNKYLYVLYSGRTPIEVTKELNKSSGYIYVEQFDWNGNPIHKYKLDHWGYFCVNEKENTIYLVSTTAENPFFSYKIPDN